VKTFGEDGSEGSKSYDSVADAFDGVNVAFTGFEQKVNNHITEKVNDVIGDKVDDIIGDKVDDVVGKKVDEAISQANEKSLVQQDADTKRITI
ncbi:hypothetical protein, partial [Bartonella sp. SD1336NMGDW]|uniref:hypothetical protein n=1 Tax=Bartonella sp. SD1336NMGDW TaxID=3243575 RepID=UPI0035D0C47A